MRVRPLKPRTSGCVHNQNPFGVFLDMDSTHLTPGLPYALRSLGFDLSDYPFEKLYKELFGTLKAYERIENKETIVHCGRNLFLSLHPFVPWSTSVFFPRLPFSCELLSRDGGLRWWRPKWGIQFLRFVDAPTEVVFIIISDFMLIEISFPIQ